MTTQRLRSAVLLCLAHLVHGMVSTANAFLLYEPQLLGEGVPSALNESSQVVGYRWDPVLYQPTAMLWHPQDGPVDLFPGQVSQAYDINARGDIVAGTRRRLLLTAEGIHKLEGIHYTAVALNNLLQAVGGGRIWEAGEIRSIDGVRGMDINDRGQVAGSRGDAAVVGPVTGSCRALAGGSGTRCWGVWNARKGSRDGNGPQAFRDAFGLPSRVQDDPMRTDVRVLLDERPDVARVHRADSRGGLDLDGQDRLRGFDDEIDFLSGSRAPVQDLGG